MRPLDTLMGVFWSLIALAFVAPVLAVDVVAQAQSGRGAVASARAGAPIDLTGQWVAIISEDWRWRMITPSKGDIVSIPLTLQGQQAAEAWVWWRGVRPETRAVIDRLTIPLR